MHENQGNSVIYYAHYTEGGVNKTGLTVTIDVYEVIRDGTATLVVNDGACTEIGAGLYRYLLASASVDAAAEYIGVFHTATTSVDAQDIPAMWVIDRAGTEKLDAGITLADDAITASKFDESTAYPLKSADTGATALARTGADSDTLETLSDQIDGAALEATLTAIKGSGWQATDSLRFIEANASSTYSVLDESGAVRILIDSIITHLEDIKGVGWSDETLVALGALLDAIKAKTDNLPADPADDSDIDAAIAAVKSVVDNIHDTDLPAVKTETAAIKAKTDLIPASPAEAGEYTAAIGAIPTAPLLAANYTAPDNAGIAAIKTVVDDLHNTDIPAIPTAAEIWTNPIRTLTVPSVAIASNVDGTTLSLYKDADINIEFTGLTIPTGSKKVVFTIKDNLDDADTASALQATYQLVAPSTETHTLNYINSAVPTGLTNPVTFTVDTDSVEFDMTAAAAYLLPRYERGYLHWDLKLITATTVQILQQGLVQILGTSTRAVA